MKRSPMKQGAGLKRTAFKQNAPSTSTGILRVAAAERKAPARKAKLKSKQRAVSADEKLLWDRLAQLGCVACMKDGNYNPHVSIHHVDGRTKPGCHQLVLPLCAGHHQDGTGNDLAMVAVHPYKARFEKLYGKQDELITLCAVLLEGRV